MLDIFYEIQHWIYCVIPFFILSVSCAGHIWKKVWAHPSETMNIIMQIRTCCQLTLDFHKREPVRQAVGIQICIFVYR